MPASMPSTQFAKRDWSVPVSEKDSITPMQPDEVCISFGYYEGEACESGSGYVCPRDLWEAYDDARSAMWEAEDAIVKYPIRRVR
jgi:hypothetical protein